MSDDAWMDQLVHWLLCWPVDPLASAGLSVHLQSPLPACCLSPFVSLVWPLVGHHSHLCWILSLVHCLYLSILSGCWPSAGFVVGTWFRGWSAGTTAGTSLLVSFSILSVCGFLF